MGIFSLAGWNKEALVHTEGDIKVRFYRSEISLPDSIQNSLEKKERTIQGDRTLTQLVRNGNICEYVSKVEYLNKMAAIFADRLKWGLGARISKSLSCSEWVNIIKFEDYNQLFVKTVELLAIDGCKKGISSLVGGVLGKPMSSLKLHETFLAARCLETVLVVNQACMPSKHRTTVMSRLKRIALDPDYYSSPPLADLPFYSAKPFRREFISESLSGVQQLFLDGKFGKELVKKCRGNLHQADSDNPGRRLTTPYHGEIAKARPSVIDFCVQQKIAPDELIDFYMQRLQDIKLICNVQDAISALKRLAPYSTYHLDKLHQLKNNPSIYEHFAEDIRRLILISDPTDAHTFNDFLTSGFTFIYQDLPLLKNLRIEDPRVDHALESILANASVPNRERVEAARILKRRSKDTLSFALSLEKYLLEKDEFFVGGIVKQIGTIDPNNEQVISYIADMLNSSTLDKRKKAYALVVAIRPLSSLITTLLVAHLKEIKGTFRSHWGEEFSDSSSDSESDEEVKDVRRKRKKVYFHLLGDHFSTQSLKDLIHAIRYSSSQLSREQKTNVISILENKLIYANFLGEDVARVILELDPQNRIAHQFSSLLDNPKKRQDWADFFQRIYFTNRSQVMQYINRTKNFNSRQALSAGAPDTRAQNTAETLIVESADVSAGVFEESGDTHTLVSTNAHTLTNSCLETYDSSEVADSRPNYLENPYTIQRAFSWWNQGFITVNELVDYLADYVVQTDALVYSVDDKVYFYEQGVRSVFIAKRVVEIMQQVIKKASKQGVLSSL